MCAHLKLTVPTFQPLSLVEFRGMNLVSPQKTLAFISGGGGGKYVSSEKVINQTYFVDQKDYGFQNHFSTEEFNCGCHQNFPLVGFDFSIFGQVEISL